MSSSILRRAFLRRATAGNPFSSSTYPLSPPNCDSTAVPTAVSVLTHHRSKSRWSRLSSLFPHGFSSTQISQILLKIRNNPHLALNFFHFTTRKNSLSSPATLHSYATIIHILARARLKSDCQSLIKAAIVNGFDDCNEFCGKRSKLFRVLVETYRVCDSAPFVFDLLIKSFLEMNKLDPCVEIVRMLQSRGIYLNVTTLNTLIFTAFRLKGCFFGNDLYREVFGLIRDDDDDKNGKLRVNCKVSPNVHTFNELMLSFYKNGLIDMVEEIWIEMGTSNCEPNAYSYEILMAAYCDEGEMEKAQNVLEELIAKGLNTNSVAYNTLIGGYCRMGKIEKGEELFREMEMGGIEGSFATYQHLVNGYCMVGNADLAMLLYKDMIRKGFRPDSLTIDSIVRVLCDKRSALEALEFFLSAMENAVFVAKKTSYEFLIEGLCGEGKMEEALKLQAQMVGKGFRPNSRIYGAFVDGYIKLGKLDLAESLRKEMMATQAL